MLKVDWEKLRAEFIGSPGMSLTEFARQHNLPEGSVHARSQKEGWLLQRKNMQAANALAVIQEHKIKDYTDKDQLAGALLGVVKDYQDKDQDEKIVTAGDVVKAVRQLHIMAGGVSSTVEHRVIVYESVNPNTFPEAKTFTGDEVDAIEVSDAEFKEISNDESEPKGLHEEISSSASRGGNKI